MGKTSILCNYINYLNKLHKNGPTKTTITTPAKEPHELAYEPTSIEIYTSEFTVNFQDYTLSITDLSGNNLDERFVQTRKYYYFVEKVKHLYFNRM